MTFEAAFKKMGKIAKGEYFHVGYERTTHSDGSLEQDCSLYISERNICHGRTWKEAFRCLEKEVSPPQPKTEKGPDEIEGKDEY